MTRYAPSVTALSALAVLLDRIAADEEALYRSAREAGHLPPGGVSDTFVRPCLVCGITVHVVDGRERDHLHHVFEADESLAAFAWWQGHDSADAELEQARAEVEAADGQRRATEARISRLRDRWRDCRDLADKRLAQAEAAESALTEAREQLSRVREALEGLADEWDEKVRDRRHRRDRIPRGSSLSINQERDRSEWQGELRAYNHAAERVRAVLADVPPAVQGDTGDAPPDEQEAGEARCRDCGAPWMPVRRQECVRCGSDAGPAQSGSDDTKGGE